MPKIRACAICGKAFMAEGKRATCSAPCADLFSSYKHKQRAELVQRAEAGKRPPLTDCKMYIERPNPTCIGLTGLWCEWEECKFYKPKFQKKKRK